jgi:hypothetical protein
MAKLFADRDYLHAPCSCEDFDEALGKCILLAGCMDQITIVSQASFQSFLTTFFFHSSNAVQPLNSKDAYLCVLS